MVLYDNDQLIYEEAEANEQIIQDKNLTSIGLSWVKDMASCQNIVYGSYMAYSVVSSNPYLMMCNQMLNLLDHYTKNELVHVVFSRGSENVCSKIESFGEFIGVIETSDSVNDGIPV